MPDAPPRRAVPGRALVTRRALVEIVRAAVLGSYGVTGLAETFLHRLGLGRAPIRVRLEPEVAVDVRLTIAYGLPVAEVARQVDSAIRYALGRALGREIGAVTIHVEGLAGGPFTTPGRGPGGGPARGAGPAAGGGAAEGAG
jgi:uncharacterized alkaline shock family protein YloU